MIPVLHPDSLQAAADARAATERKILESGLGATEASEQGDLAFLSAFVAAEAKRQDLVCVAETPLRGTCGRPKIHGQHRNPQTDHMSTVPETDRHDFQPAIVIPLQGKSVGEAGTTTERDEPA